tara:strand:+ start:43 stop:333 length:291 start_codon:yes stop_codon:yes gene_type:complete
MAFADPEKIRRILSGAGFEEISIDGLEMGLPFEADAQSTARRLVQASGGVTRLLNNQPEDIKLRVEQDLCDAVADLKSGDRITLGSATWVVTATAP